MPPTPLPNKVILVDGPAAGRVMDADEHSLHIEVMDPYPPLFVNYDADPAPFTPSPRSHYLVDRIIFRIAGDLMLLRIGWSKPEQRAEGIAEHVPTALAREKIVPWSWVKPTQLDETDPIATAGGDPSRPCTPETEDYLGRELRGFCTCGWETDLLPSERGSQLARALRRHVYDLERRRHTEDLPIRILESGVGPNAACNPTIDLQTLPTLAAKPAVHGETVHTNTREGWVRGSCAGCGWRTWTVPPPAIRKLMALGDGHLDQACEVFRTDPLLAVSRARRFNPDWHFEWPIPHPGPDPEVDDE